MLSATTKALHEAAAAQGYRRVAVGDLPLPYIAFKMDGSAVFLHARSDEQVVHTLAIRRYRSAMRGFGLSHSVFNLAALRLAKSQAFRIFPLLPRPMASLAVEDLLYYGFCEADDDGRRRVESASDFNDAYAMVLSPFIDGVRTPAGIAERLTSPNSANHFGDLNVLQRLVHTIALCTAAKIGHQEMSGRLVEDYAAAATRSHRLYGIAFPEFKILSDDIAQGMTSDAL